MASRIIRDSAAPCEVAAYLQKQCLTPRHHRRPRRQFDVAGSNIVGHEASHLARIARRKLTELVERPLNALGLAAAQVVATIFEMDELLATAGRADAFGGALVCLELVGFHNQSSIPGVSLWMEYHDTISRASAGPQGGGVAMARKSYRVCWMGRANALPLTTWV